MLIAVEHISLLTSHEVADLPRADIRTCISEQCYDAPPNGILDDLDAIDICTVEVQ